MDRSDGNVQSRGNRGGNKSSVSKKEKGSEKGSASNVQKSNSYQASGKSNKEFMLNFWYSYDVSKAQLSIFRFFFFMLHAVDSFEQLPRTYKITGSMQNHFNLPHFSFPFSLLPPPSGPFLMGAWIASFFLGFRVAFGKGGQFDVILLALLKGYTVFVSQVDNYQHHYLTVLLLVILAHVPWKSLYNSKACSWPIRLLLVQLSFVYFWTAFAKVEAKWISGEVLPLAVGPEFVTYMNTYGPNIWSFLSVGTIIAELLLCVLLQIPSLHWCAVIIGVPMHILMGISGLRIGRFSEMMVVMYILLFPRKVVHFVDLIFANTSKLIPSNTAVTILLYTSSFVVLKLYGVVEVLPVVQFVLIGIFILDLSEQFLGRSENNGFPHQFLAAIALVFLCFYTPHLRDAYIAGGTMALPQRDMGTVVEFYSLALKIDPDYVDGLGDMGLFLESVGKHDEAKEKYEHVLGNLDKENLKALVGMMRVYDHKKDRDKVCTFVNRAGPLAHHASQAHCVSQDCARAKGHAGYVLQTARNLDQKWNCGN